MKDNQIEIDSSVFPGKRAHGGIPTLIVRNHSILNTMDI